MRHRILAIVCSMLVGCVLVYAQATAPAKPKPPGEDWVQLFNGKDFTGWKKVGQQDWSVTDGIIVGRAA